MMKMFVLAVCLAALQVVGLPAASAQDKRRADVKAETASAVKAGATPRGDVGAPAVTGAKSTKVRPAVKAEAASASKAGTIPKGEVMPDKPAAKSTMTAEEKAAARAKRRAEAASANKARAIPKGEASN